MLTKIKTVGDWTLCLSTKDDKNKPLNKETISAKNIVFDSKLFKTCPFKDYVFQNQCVYLIIVVGSRLCDLIDGLSDVDLVVFTKKNYYPKKEYRLLYKGCEIHWYYRTPLSLLDNYSMLELCGMFHYRFLENEHCIYKGAKADAFWDRLKTNKYVISQFGFESFYKKAKCYCDLLLNNNFKDLNDLPLKFYHKIIHAYYIYFNIEFDKEFIMKVKRMRYSALTNNELLRLKTELQKYLNAMSGYEFSIDKLKEQWVNVWRNFETPEQ